MALVTGASRGIGFGIAGALAAEGAHVAVSSRSQERIEAAAAKIGARAYVHDSTDLDAAPRPGRAAWRRTSARSTVLVTNTGGPPQRGVARLHAASTGRPPTASSCSRRWR